MPLDPAFAAMLEAAAAAGGPALSDMTPAEGREMYRQMQPLATDLAVAKVEDRSIPGPAGDIPVRIYTPEGNGPFGLFVMFHGGGWVIGDLDTSDGQSRNLCRTAGCVVVSVDYRLAPEHVYPAAADDCYAATCWAAENASALGADPDRLAVGGDSAGGNLGAAVALMARDKGGPKIAFQLLVYPVTDADLDTGSYRENAEGYMLTRDSMKWFWDQYCPDEALRRQAYACPLQAQDLSGLPPALVFTAEFDPLRDEGEAYAERLKAAGVPCECVRYDGFIHGFWAMAHMVPSAAPSMERAAAALKKVIG